MKIADLTVEEFEDMLRKTIEDEIEDLYILQDDLAQYNLYIAENLNEILADRRYNAREKSVILYDCAQAVVGEILRQYGAHLDDLRHDGHGDLFRRLRPDVQPDGRVHPRNGFAIGALLDQVLEHGAHPPPRADHADVRRRLPHDLPQAGLVVPVAAGHAHDVGVGVHRQVPQHLIEAAAGHLVGLREALGVGVLRPVIDDGDGEAAEVADDGERLAHVRATDDDEMARSWTRCLEQHRLHPDRLVWNDEVLDRLVATPRLKEMLLAGAEPAEIFASWQGEVQAFRARSAPYLLYE